MILTWQNTALEFKEQLPHIAILPFANLEPHGPHLPIGTDRIIVSEIARGVAAHLPASTFLLPTWSLGTSIQHAGQSGTISLGFETLWAVVNDIVLSLYEHSIRKVVVINNHGSPKTSTAWPSGNFIVKTAVRQLNYEHSGLNAIWVQPFAVGRQALKDLFPLADQDIHEGEVEISLLMHLAPTLVSLSPGQVDKAITAEKGKSAFDAVVHATVEYIEYSFNQISQMKG